MVIIDVGDPKMAKEVLCEMQSLLNTFYDSKDANIQREAVEPKLARVQKMIDQIDIHRPVGPNGKHGNLHTATCGCENVVVCSQCGKVRTSDIPDYTPTQAVVPGLKLGWYSGKDGEICPKDIAQLMSDVNRRTYSYYGQENE